MRKRFIGPMIAIVAIVVYATIVFPQAPGGASGQAVGQGQEIGGENIPCVNDWQRDGCQPRTGALTPRDLSGVWVRVQGSSNMGETGTMLLTPLGKKLYSGNKSHAGPNPVQGSLSNDPMLACDPVGLTRSVFTDVNSRSFEFVHTSDRVLQFFEWNHQHRTIWTDGRQLPKDPEPRWMGYSVGSWEGDTFVIDSVGLDDRSWTDIWGHPHSLNMRVQERYRRPSFATLEFQITITDPEVYAKPWVSETKVLQRQLEKGMDDKLETFCVPSEEQAYIRDQLNPAEGFPNR